MLKKLFSCLGDTTQNNHVDLSSPTISPENPMNKPTLHPESNVIGQDINFYSDDQLNL